VKGVAALFIVALEIACGKGSGSSPPKPKDVADAVKLIEIGQCESAATKLRTYTSSNPDSFDGFLVLGDALVCSCYDPAAKTPQGMSAPAKCKEALATYESALKLRKDSVPALVSVGALSLMFKDEAAATASLETAVKREPRNAAAANLLALAKQKADEAQGYALLEGHYANRKPAEVTPPTIESLCGTSLQCGTVVLLETVTQKDAPADGTSISQDDPPPPPDEEENADGTGGTGTAMALNEGKMGKKDSSRAQGQYKMKKVTDGNTSAALKERTYGVGTVIEDAELDGERVAFIDRQYPDLRKGTGWVLDGIHRQSFDWQRRTGLESARVLSEKPPQEPVEETGVMTPAREAWLAWGWAWGAWGCGASRCLSERDIPGFEARLKPVADIAAESVKATGAPVNIAQTGSLSFIPVEYQQKLFSRRHLPTKSVAVVRGGDPARIASLKFLSPAEKRSVLAGQLWKGTPLFVGVRARQYKVTDAALSLREGRVTLRFANDGQVEAYDGGECVSPVNPQLNEPSGEGEE